jgi:hypothetical protein
VPTESTEPVEPAAAEAEPVAAEGAEPDVATRGVPVMAEAGYPDEITVYDNVVAIAPEPPISEEECAEITSVLKPSDQELEERARADIAAAATAPLDQRYFLYRETYGQRPQPSIIELTSAEFAMLGGSGAYLHVEDCTLIGAVNLSPDTVEGIERLLERAITRPDARLPRAELERLVVAGRVVSCAVY